MRNPFKFVGISELCGEKVERYIYKSLSVVVSHGNFSVEQNRIVEVGQEVLHISMSSLNGSAMRQSDINTCLDHFGLRRSSHNYSFERKSAFPPHNLVKHFEQIQSSSGPLFDALPS